MNRAALIGACLILVAPLIALVPISLSSQIQQSFGSFFACTLIAAFVYMHHRLQERAESAKKVNYILLGLSVLTFTVATRGLQEWIPTGNNTMEEAQRVVRGIAEELDPKRNGNITTPAIYFTFTSPIPSFDVAIEFYKRYGNLPSSLVEAYTLDETVAKDGISAYQYVVMYSPDRIPKINEANKEQARFQEAIFSSWNLAEIATYPFAGGEYRLYRVEGRKDATSSPSKAL